MVAIRTGTEACPYEVITLPTGRMVGFSNNPVNHGFGRFRSLTPPPVFSTILPGFHVETMRRTHFE